ncbi:MAG: hypothetical protein ACRYGG_20685, partial [Janthinobacterium lividum]
WPEYSCRLYKGAMKIGVSGHQQRPGLDWQWVGKALFAEMSQLDDVTDAFSSLAEGSDQLFAITALRCGFPLTTVVPLYDYEQFFNSPALEEYKRLLHKSKVVSLDGEVSAEESFLHAGKYIAGQSDLLYLVWDGKPAEGVGGTGDIAAYALNHKKVLRWLNPFTHTITDYTTR